MVGVLLPVPVTLKFSVELALRVSEPRLKAERGPVPPGVMEWGA